MLLRILVCFMFLFSSIAYSHGPTRQKVKESIDINASVEDTWKMVKNLGLSDKWHSEYSSLSPQKNFFKYISKRDGSNGLIEILSTRDESMRFKYRLKNPGSVPVNNYSANISVKNVDGISKVTFKGAFYRKYVNNDPPPGEDDEAAIEAVTRIYKKSLKTLKSVLENN